MAPLHLLVKHFSDGTLGRSDPGPIDTPAPQKNTTRPSSRSFRRESGMSGPSATSSGMNECSYKIQAHARSCGQVVSVLFNRFVR